MVWDTGSRLLVLTSTLSSCVKLPRSKSLPTKDRTMAPASTVSICHTNHGNGARTSASGRRRETMPGPTAEQENRGKRFRALKNNAVCLLEQQSTGNGDLPALFVVRGPLPCGRGDAAGTTDIPSLTSITVPFVLYRMIRSRAGSQNRQKPQQTGRGGG